MKTYILKRIIQIVPVLFLIALMVFILLRLIPGDPVLVMVGDEAEPGMVEALRHEMGLDKPLMIQFFYWLVKIIQLDFGTSITYRMDVLPLILQRLPVTLTFGLFSTLFAVALAVPSGIIAAVHQNTYKDYLFTLLAVFGVSIPSFWLALMFIMFFSLNLGWFPATGYVSPFTDFFSGMKYLVLPCVSHGILTAAIIARMTRSTMLEVLRQDYITTAKGKGLPHRWVIYKHALKNAFAPTLTIIGFQLGNVLGGAVITETIFTLPGLGQLVYHAIGQRDYPVIQACILITAVGFVFINLMVDLLYSYFDPRIRYED
ncbi:MAG: ABC transporter permease [Desulfobacterales bacterium]|nr:ABC transporter permease [Desulfobacterales bacterium]